MRASWARPPISSASCAAGVLAFLATSASAQFAFDPASMPTTATGYTENVDFADVDRDGDWDVVLADGGDFGNQQNRLWINGGFLQGGTVGVFSNGTATRFPALLDDSRDVELGDFDNDGDLDVYVAETSHIANQPSRWWINQGGASGGTLGYFADETAARWSGLDAPGTSLAPSVLLVAGGFIDFSCDCDFGDLDDDGDLDLVHSSYGGAFGGEVPTRLFLNDGAGVFAEFNPSGFRLGGLTILTGNPGLWCEGTQLSHTTNTSGATCDVATTALDVEIGDVDGDLDLDLLLGAREEAPRMFRNRREENGGVLAFRDVTSLAFPAGSSTGGAHYAQELGDFDSDGDLDVYGVNWRTSFGFDDVALRNDGAGSFGGLAVISGSSSDENEADFVDFDVDGDLDVIVANFAGQERLHRNNGAGAFTLASGVLPGDGSNSRDADACDVDLDGDYDLVVANDSNQAEAYLKNGTSANDVTPPSIPVLEQVADRVASAEPTSVRAQVHDNAPYYVAWSLATGVEVSVDGGASSFHAAVTSQGDVFRAEIPGTLVGVVAYRMRSTDAYGNTGVSSWKSYTATSGTVGTSLCFGDGSGTACPCGNSGASARGCANSLFAAGAVLGASGTASLAADTLVLNGFGMPNSSALFFQGDAAVAAGAGAVFGDGLRCVQSSVVRLATKTNVSNGSQYPQAGDAPISVRAGIASPATKLYQVWYRNADAAFCTSATFNLSNALAIDWTP